MSPEAIKAQARALGFELCGIAPADDFPELAVLDEWLARGYAGQMAWMAKTAERRRDVRRVLPTARSVIVTASLYNTDRPNSRDLPAGVARISRYAWGDDYHDVLEPRLHALVDWLRERETTPFEARVYVDTGPVQERVYAQYAGLGWIGKNTCLINPELGSWLFLGVVITSLDLASDTQGLEQCGSCTQCLDACPTQALVEPGVLDATRCISYLTIEHRGEVPQELQPALGAHLYGCDICQDVCPYNHPAPLSTEPAWQPRPDWDRPALDDLARRPEAELWASLSGSPMRRPKLAGWRRNLAIVLANQSESNSSQPGDESPRTRATPRG